MPAMVSAIQAPEGRITGIHRTFLQRDGRGKANVSEPKMMLGPMRGGAVRLTPAAEEMALAEGVETALSVLQAARLATWACLSAGGIRNTVLPPLPMAGLVVIAADHDANGVGQKAAEEAGERFIREGRRVKIILPPRVGADWNDMLREVA